MISAVFRSVTKLLEPARVEKKELEKSLGELGIVTALIMGEGQSFERPYTHVRLRGSFLSKGEKCTRGFQAA